MYWIKAFRQKSKARVSVPLISNAIKYSKLNSTSFVKISSFVFENKIGLAIEDNGIGRDEAKKLSNNKNGKGTKLMKERFATLQKKYKEKYQIQFVCFYYLNFLLVHLP